MTDSHYTTITIKEYNHLAFTILDLRKRLQTLRELLEKGAVADALEILRTDKSE